MTSVFHDIHQTLRNVQPATVEGRVCGVRGLTVSVADFPAPVGGSCRIGDGIEGRVIGFANEQTLVMALGSIAGICRGDRVRLVSRRQSIGVGAAMLGRVIDSQGKPIDGGADIVPQAQGPLWPGPISAMRRRRIDQPLATGVRAIDALLTIGCGQRMAIIAGSGVGKSVLLGMIGRHTDADVTVIALIGERGREVRDFIERDLGEEGLRNAVVVVSTSDEPPLARVQAAATATAVAEYFRSQGSNVLLLMDSLTRLAAAQRQIGLAAGEPPATKGYPPSVFTLLPELLERAGRTADGAITGFYTVLVESDDLTDPIADAVRSVTDGHMCLSRDLASRGQYPAVDMLRSISRVMTDVAEPAHQQAARQTQALLAAYAEIEELVRIGAYHRGASVECDMAIDLMPSVRAFLSQTVTEGCAYDATQRQLKDLHERIGQARSQLSRQAAMAVKA